ncbi:hypothetical protein LV779_01365 [Streptomyces thinghirensis]|nr:hypothetical protein [Streptomyces thinghirensis]
MDVRPAAEDAVGGLGHLRAARARLHQAAPRHPRGAARHVRGAGASRGDRAPDAAGRDGGGAAAGAPVRAREPSPRPRPEELLGLQLDRLLRPHAAYAASGTTGQQVGEFKADGARPARGGHRGDPRRGLQPHGGGGRAGPDAVPSRASTTAATTASSRTPAGTPTTPAAATPCTSCSRTSCA